MDQFSIVVSGITTVEYRQACRLNNRRAYKILAVAMVFICGIFMLAFGEFSVSAVAWPAGIYAVCVVALELMTVIGYKGQLESVEPVTYSFGEGGWKVSAGGQSFEFKWEATPKLVKTRDCVFVYNDGASSNLLSKRLLSEENICDIEKWFAESRTAAKQYAREQRKKERDGFRSTHKNVLFGRSGPAWGPWKKP